MSDVAARLDKAAGGGGGISSFDGQTVNVVSIEKTPSTFKPGETAVKATILDANGNEAQVYVTPTGARQLLEVEDVLPLELKVVSFPGQFGKTGYKFEAV